MESLSGLPVKQCHSKGRTIGDEINDLIVNTNADLGVVFGSGILSAEIISKCPKLLNLHQGVSPYFRGSGTNFGHSYSENLSMLE